MQTEFYISALLLLLIRKKAEAKNVNLPEYSSGIQEYLNHIHYLIDEMAFSSEDKLTWVAEGLSKTEAEMLPRFLDRIAGLENGNKRTTEEQVKAILCFLPGAGPNRLSLSEAEFCAETLLKEQSTTNKEVLCIGECTYLFVYESLLRGFRTIFVYESNQIRLIANILLAFSSLGNQKTGSLQLFGNFEEFEKTNFSSSDDYLLCAFPYKRTPEGSFLHEISQKIIELAGKVSRAIFLLSPSDLSLPTTDGLAARQYLVSTGNIESVTLLKDNFRPIRRISLAFILTDKKLSSSATTFRFIELPLSKGAENFSLTVSNIEIIKHDYCLDINKYRALKFGFLARLTKENSFHLSDIAKIIRPQSFPKKDVDEEQVNGQFPRIVMLSDIDDMGFVSNPKNPVSILEGGEKRARQAQLENGDILFSFKGGSRKVGYVLLKENEFWVASQSFIIIRLKPELANMVPKEYLFRYLTSDFFQKYLALIEKSHAGMMIYAMDDVKAFPIRIPSREIIAEQNSLFNEVLKLRQEVLSLEHSIQEKQMKESSFSSLNVDT